MSIHVALRHVIHYRCDRPIQLRPLVFDQPDTWMQRLRGGCQYHVAHPGGSNYQRLPVNAHEAESRRMARFFRHGHTPGVLIARQPMHNDRLPMILDLRRS